MPIRLGVAGWDYPDWDGVVYPAGRRRSFDRLAYLSRFVDVIEINSTFYRPVRPIVAVSWVRRTAARPDFLFTAKAHSSLTHEPGSVLAAAAAATLAGLAPLREAGRLGALLLQFPQSFHYGPAARERLAHLAELTRGWPAVIEVRHASWSAEEAAAWLANLGLGWCAVDQPRIGTATLGLLPRVLGPVGYLRLHGRNAASWFRQDAGRDARYDYLYAEAELAELAGPVAEMAATAEQVFVVQNNHFRGQALVNTLQLAHRLHGSRPPAPRELVAAYPELAPIVTPEPAGLF